MTAEGAPDRIARIDTAAVRANVRRLRGLAGTPDLMAVVKADGYGHGMVTVARAALEGGATWLGVADPAEALALRRAGVTAPVLAWLLDEAADFGPVAAADVDLGVSTAGQLERIAATAPGAAVQLKVETGLSRNGLAPAEWDRVFRLAAGLEREGRIRVRGLFSHLANTSDEEDAAAEARFADAVRRLRDAGLEPPLHAPREHRRRDRPGPVRLHDGAHRHRPVRALALRRRRRRPPRPHAGHDARVARRSRAAGARGRRRLVRLHLARSGADHARARPGGLRGRHPARGLEPRRGAGRWPPIARPRPDRHGPVRRRGRRRGRGRRSGGRVRRSGDGRAVRRGLGRAGRTPSATRS